jgi:hypothetical protein
MYDLTNFTLRDMTACGAALRKLGEGARTLEEVAGRTVRYLYEQLTEGPNGPRMCALVRFFKTHPYSDLEESLRARARQLLGDHAAASTLECLVLLATAGDLPAWNVRTASARHRAIPLSSAEMLRTFPMIARLVQQFGLNTADLLEPTADADLFVTPGQHTYNVFHIAEARGSPFVPAQEDFVEPYGIRSVLGFGGLLPTGHLFAIILFAKAPVSRDTAELFKPLALSVKLAVLPFAGGPVFS